jgi:hypothetical protein
MKIWKKIELPLAIIVGLPISLWMLFQLPLEAIISCVVLIFCCGAILLWAMRLDVMNKVYDLKYGHNLKKQKEIILCAAIWYKDLDAVDNPKSSLRLDEEAKEALEIQRLPINCDKGMVFCGHRHLQAMRTMNSITGLTDNEAGDSVQGFLTNYNRFVDRREGGKIAWEAGQTETLETYMFSEHLY